MRENALQARQRRRFKRTTDSLHAFRVAPNLLNQDFNATGPNQKWGADISRPGYAEGWPTCRRRLTSLQASSAGPPATGSIRNWRRCWPYAAVAVRCPSAGSSTTRTRWQLACSVEHQAELSSRMSARETASTTPAGRDVLQDPQGRTRLAHLLQSRIEAAMRNRPLHRRLLQSRPPPFGARLHQPASVRRAGSVKSKTLSTNAGQVHRCSPSCARRAGGNGATMWSGSWRSAKLTDLLQTLADCQRRARSASTTGARRAIRFEMLLRRALCAAFGQGPHCLRRATFALRQTDRPHSCQPRGPILTLF